MSKSWRIGAALVGIVVLGGWVAHECTEPGIAMDVALEVQMVGEPTKDYANDATVTPSMAPKPRTEPANGVYAGMTDGEVAEEVRSSMEFRSVGAASIVAYSEIMPEQMEGSWWLAPEQVAEGTVPDLGIVLEGAFHPFLTRFAAERLSQYVLIVVDRTYGEYSFTFSDDLAELEERLP
jgi:hypothetical protein